MAKPTLFSKIGTEAKLLTYAENILKKSQENAVLFPQAASTIVELEAALKAYRNGLAEAAYRDMRQIVIKNQYAATLKQVLYRYALYVEVVANGDPNIILAAGYMPSKSSAGSVGSSPKPHDLRVEIYQGGNNAVQLRVESWRPARYCQFEYRKVGSGIEWTKVLSTKSKTVIQDLEHLQEYEFRVTYLGADPTPNYSDTVRGYVV
ncbi:hypothetical protein FXV77_18425 [Sphingobacterium phlebotomi]|uniref:Fibronectin type-III domain-containing protein n=1 Tax=Sphingobacterium phlebotomi TaxID=2605433 RepID=A0A5D4GYE9_9SPHI|nr:hypothetical protein [Sphingobacterium phlebotomi]TYR33013.1 hypothetical protein FXV77_18425 [Sphingobacterium phlebotomi]